MQVPTKVMVGIWLLFVCQALRLALVEDTEERSQCRRANINMASDVLRQGKKLACYYV